MEKTFVVASSSATFGIFHHETVTRLEAAGCSVRINPYGRPLTTAEIVAHAEGADCLILGNDKLEASAIRKLPRLRLIVRHGAGLDGIDFNETTQRGIVVANAPGANAEATADLTFGLILDLSRFLTRSIEQLKSGVWNKIPGHSLYGKTIGIIGVGNIGMRVARRAMGFGMDIIGTDIVEREEAARYGLLYSPLNELLSKSDIVTLHIPLTSATKNLIGALELRRMKEGAILVNTARAGIVRESALEKALLSGHLGGYATDVYKKEPPGTSTIQKLPNVLTTPHIGSATFEANLRMGMAVVDNILAFKDGFEPPNLVTAIDRVKYS